MTPFFIFAVAVEVVMGVQRGSCSFTGTVHLPFMCKYSQLSTRLHKMLSSTALYSRVKCRAWSILELSALLKDNGEWSGIVKSVCLTLHVLTCSETETSVLKAKIFNHLYSWWNSLKIYPRGVFPTENRKLYAFWPFFYKTSFGGLKLQVFENNTVTTKHPRLRM